MKNLRYNIEKKQLLKWKKKKKEEVINIKKEQKLAQKDIKKKFKQELKNEAGGDNLKEDDWLGKYEISKHVFESHGKSKELLERLVKYKGDILGIDPKINARFGVVDNYLSDRTGYRIINPTEEIKLFSIDIPVIAAYTQPGASSVNYNCQVPVATCSAEIASIYTDVSTCIASCCGYRCGSLPRSYCPPCRYNPVINSCIKHRVNCKYQSG